LDLLEILHRLGISLGFLDLGLLELFQDLLSSFACETIVDLELYGLNVVLERGTGRTGQSFHQSFPPFLQCHLFWALLFWLFGVFLLFGVLNNRLLIEFECLSDDGHWIDEDYAILLGYFLTEGGLA
jgi:hypothetical protein